MKKFLKWSAAFLVLGVLAVGCIKNEPSPGIEAMRNAKASLLNAQAALTQAKVQVEAANAALIQAQAGLIQAQEAVVAAQARKIDAETALIEEQIKWDEALREFHTEAWALQIAELEAQLAEEEARVAAQIAAYELQIANMQAQMVAAQKAYEEAMLLFEKWKIENADVLGKALIEELDALSRRIQRVIIALGRRQVDLDYAKAQYLWYVNVEYPEETSHIIQQMEANKRRLECEIEYLTGVADAYDALYNEYHGDFDALIAGFQETITALRAEIAELELAFIQLQEEWLLFDHDALDAANLALTKKRTVSITGVFSDGGDDPNIHVNDGTYKLTNWGWASTPSMFTIMDRDIRVIEDTRSELEDQDSGIIERNIASKKATADAAVKGYEDNWKLWQKYYDEARITGSHVGSRYVAWQNAWTAWDAQMYDFRAHQNTYEEMYYTADSLIRLFMDYLDGWLNEGTLVVPGSENLSEVLGGIEFNAGTLAEFIFQGNAAAVINALNTIIGLINAPAEMEAIVTELKAIMDGTHPEGWPAFWDHATSWQYTPASGVPPYGDIMRAVYANSNKELTELTNQDWYAWLFLYWLFEDKTVELGLEDPYGGPVITINPSAYDDAAEEVLEDFFGELKPRDYKKGKKIVLPAPGVDYTAPFYVTYMKAPSNQALLTAIDDYYKAVVGLGLMETAMFRPYNREWFAYAKHKDIGGGDIFVMTRDLAYYTYWDKKPFLVYIAPTPDTYTPKTYDDDFTKPDPDDSPLDHETQPDPEGVSNFFFVLEAYKDEVGPIPSLDFDITYLDDDCDLYVSYAALLAAGDDCIWQSSSWVGDMRLWKWDDKKDYEEKGHYFYAIWQTRDYQAYLDTYNRVLNGEYEALIDKIQALSDTQWAAYLEAKAVRDALQAELTAIENAIKAIGGYYDSVKHKWVLGVIDQYELWIRSYQILIEEAQRAHNGGNVAEDGLLEAWNEAKHELIESQNELNAIEEALAIWEEGLGLPTFFWGFVENETARYQARIDAILEDIARLQQKLVILEGIRAGLVEDYL